MTVYLCHRLTYNDLGARWDVDQSRSLSFSEFDAAMAEVDVRLSPGEKRLIVRHLTSLPPATPPT